MPLLSPFTRRRLQKLPRTNSIWEGGRCSMPNPNEDDRDCILWVDGHQGYVRNVDMVATDGGNEPIVRSLLQAMEHPQGPAEPGRPQRLVVNNRELQFFLRGVLQDLDIDVVYEAKLPWVDEIFDHLLSQVPAPTSLPESYGKLLEEKALALWNQSPWYRLSEQELLAVELNRWDVETLYVSILGMADVDYGLLFYRSLESLLQFRERVLHCDRMSPQVLQQIFLTQDCFFLNYSVDRPRQLEPDDYEFGSIHPLEGIRHDLDEAEASTLIVVLDTLQKFFQKAPDSLTVLEPMEKTFKVSNPMIGTSPKQYSIKIKSLPDISAELIAETEDIINPDEVISDSPSIHDELVPDGALILLTKLSIDRLQQLQQQPKIHYQPLSNHPSKPSKAPWPVVIIQTSRPKAKALVEHIQVLKGIQSMCFNPGHDPFTQVTFQLGIWQTGNGDLHLFHEYNIGDTGHRQALEKWHHQQTKSLGRCGIMIAAGVTGRNRGNPQNKDIMAFLEVNFCEPDTLGLEPLVLSYAID